MLVTRVSAWIRKEKALHPERDFSRGRRMQCRGWEWLRWPILVVLGVLHIAGACCGQDTFSTGVLEGRVLDNWDGRPLSGVVVTLRGTTLATVTDHEGLYRLRGVPPGRHELIFSRSGYARTMVTDVLVAEGQTSRVDAALRPEFYELEEYVVTAAEMSEQVVQLLEMRQRATVAMDVLGAEQFSRLAASDAADILEQVPGVTVVGGREPVVRGLNERYVGVLLNGAEVPSPDPYKKSAQLDMFPAGLIESVTVTKTFTPDLPGNFSGGGVLLKTRSFPEEFQLRLSGGVEANTRATFRDDFPRYAGGGTDWLALDDGTRALPAELSRPGLQIPRPPANSGLPSSSTYAARIQQAETVHHLTRLLGPTDFAPRPEHALPNHNFSLALGDTRAGKAHALGYFGGITYQRKFQYLDGVNNRYAPGLHQTIQPRKQFEDVQGIEEITWATVANLAWRYQQEQKLEFTFYHNQSAEDLARTQRGRISDDPGWEFVLHRLHWTERHLQSFQLHGEHTLPRWTDAKLEWLAALSRSAQEEPDARFFHYRTDGQLFQPDHQSLPTPNKPTRYFRDLEENNRSARADLTVPLRWGQDREVVWKWGGAWQQGERTFKDREVFYEGLYAPTDRFPFLGDANAFLPPESLGYRATTNAAGRISYVWNRYIQLRDSRYTGEQTVPAAYVMAEAPLTRRLRLIGGVRFEQTEIAMDSLSYVANETTGLPVNQTSLAREDWLPAVGLIFQPRTNMTVRLHFSQTLARPTFRELAAYRSYDPLTDELIEGNPRLGLSTVKNYDLRWEWFPRPGEVLSLSLFYKDLQNAIERRFVNIGGDIVSFMNRPAAEVYGVEFEFRRGLDVWWTALSGLSLGVNAAWMASEVQLTEDEVRNRTDFLGDTSRSRPLYDQSPYVVNADLTWDHPRTQTSLTVGFNIFGPRIVIAGLATPDVYEQPAPSLDVVLRQGLGRHWSVRFTARNLLDPAWERTYGEDGAAVFSRYHRGRLFGLSLSREW